MHRDLLVARVPFAPPAWLTPMRIACAAVMFTTMVGALGVGYPLASMATHGSALAWAVLLSTPLLTLGVLIPASRAKSVFSAVLRCALAAPAGVINAAIVVVLSIAVGTHREIDLGDSVPLCFVFGGGAGLFFGVVFAVPLGYAVSLRNRPSHDGADRLLVALGVWLGLWMSSIIAPLVGMFGVRPAGIALVSLAGFLPLFIGSARLVLRASWLRRVRGGQVPGWQVAPAGPEDFVSGILPLSPDAALCNAVVRRRVDDSDTPYRAAPLHTPVALVR